jgi:hypothetical protein
MLCWRSGNSGWRALAKLAVYLDFTYWLRTLSPIYRILDTLFRTLRGLRQFRCVYLSSNTCGATAGTHFHVIHQISYTEPSMSTSKVTNMQIKTNRSALNGNRINTIPEEPASSSSGKPAVKARRRRDAKENDHSIPVG